MSLNWQQIYKHSDQLGVIGQGVDTFDQLLMKDDRFKLDLDSSEGQTVFRQHMEVIEHLLNILSVQPISRIFRNNYTKAYRILYSQGQLGYIPQIFDSAQQGIPEIWVNGEHYDFSQQVLKRGQQLIACYYNLIQFLRSICLRSQDWSCQQMKQQLKKRLTNFDRSWVDYEKKYINQLIEIEQKSKSKIMKAIELQRQLTQYQNRQKNKGRIFIGGEQYDKLRIKLCNMIAHLNSIANFDGKGRDDLTYQILVAAENILTKITPSQSKSIRNMALKIRQSFQKIRFILKSFYDDFQMVDPQLKNNSELATVLLQYQYSWQKGKRYFLQTQKQNQLLAFSAALDTAKEKYSQFQQMLQYSDPKIFWIIPSLIVLRSFENQDQGLALSFLDSLPQSTYGMYQNIRNKYLHWKASQKGKKIHGCFNRIQQALIRAQLKFSENPEQTEQFIRVVTSIKQLAVSLERVSPVDWNDMLSVLLIDEES